MERRAQLRELWVRMRRSNDLEGIQRGSRRTRDTYLRVWTRCWSSKCRRYFWTTLGMVMRKAAEKFCMAIAYCFSGFFSN